MQGDLIMDGLTRYKAWPSTTGTVKPPVLDEYKNNFVANVCTIKTTSQPLHKTGSGSVSIPVKKLYVFNSFIALI